MDEFQVLAQRETVLKQELAEELAKNVQSQGTPSFIFICHSSLHQNPILTRASWLDQLKPTSSLLTTQNSLQVAHNISPFLEAVLVQHRPQLLLLSRTLKVVINVPSPLVEPNRPVSRKLTGN